MQSAPCRQAQQQQIKGGEANRNPWTGPIRTRGIEYVVERDKTESRIADGQQHQSKIIPTRNTSLVFQVHPDQARRQGEDEEEAADEKCCPARLSGRVKGDPPSEDKQ